MAGLIDILQKQYGNQMDEANAEMNRLLALEQRQPFLKGAGQGETPIPNEYLGGQLKDGILRVAIPPHLQDKYGKAMFTNMFNDPERVRLLGQMGVSPDLIQQAQQQQTLAQLANPPQDKAQKAATEAKQLIANGKVEFNAMFKAFADVFGEEAADRELRGATKTYAPQTQLLEKGGKKRFFDMNKLDEIKRANEEGWTPALKEERELQTKVGGLKEELLRIKASGGKWTQAQTEAWKLLSAEEKTIGDKTVAILKDNIKFKRAAKEEKMKMIKETENLLREAYGLDTTEAAKVKVEPDPIQQAVDYLKGAASQEDANQRWQSLSTKWGKHPSLEEVKQRMLGK